MWALRRGAALAIRAWRWLAALTTRAWLWLAAHVSWDRLIFVISVMAMVIGGLWYTSDVDRRLDCQIRYNTADNQRTRVLTEVADRERALNRRVDDAQAAAFGHPAVVIPEKDRTPQQRREIQALALAWVQAVIDQQKERADADKARAENPVPAPPLDTCGR